MLLSGGMLLAEIWRKKMNENKQFWSPRDVEKYLKNIKPGARRILPDNAYCTKDFTWNEVLMTNSKNIDIPSLEILENLQSTTEVLQNYRDKINLPITITSGWRSEREQQELITQYKQGKLKNQPSETSLHLEGLALDFAIAGSQKPIQQVVDENHFGEMEFGSNYSHVGLPTFSKKYLQKQNLDVNKFYKKLSNDGIEMSNYEKSKIIKRMNARNWHPMPSHFNSESNAKMFVNYPKHKNTSSHLFIDDDNNVYDLNNALKGTVKYNNWLPGISTGFAAQIDNDQLVKLGQQLGLQSFFLTNPQQQESKLSGYTNPLTGSSRIFTREDIDAMSTGEYSEFEKAIMAQLNSIGVPSNSDMELETITTGGVVYVHPYTRSDGTEVKGHYRSKPSF